jgi:hypothetical protein
LLCELQRLLDLLTLMAVAGHVNNSSGHCGHCPHTLATAASQRLSTTRPPPWEGGWACLPYPSDSVVRVRVGESLAPVHLRLRFGGSGWSTGWSEPEAGVGVAVDAGGPSQEGKASRPSASGRRSTIQPAPRRFRLSSVEIDPRHRSS